MPDFLLYYAIKANPHPSILELLAQKGSYFDTASVPEIEMVLQSGATADRISYGNTIKKEKDIAKAYSLGVRLFAVDCFEEIEKISRVAPGSEVFCRILTDGEGAQWPLSRKFGCAPSMAIEVLRYAYKCKLKPVGISFHVGSQQVNLRAWDKAISAAAEIFNKLALEGISLDLLNLGGGFPARYLKEVPPICAYAESIQQAIKENFRDKKLRIIIEPGRGLVAEAGVLYSEIVLVSKKEADDPVRWVYLDSGKFNGLIETLHESIRYALIVQDREGPTGPCILAGPTCDSEDVLYEKEKYYLPLSLQIGDKIFVCGAGAYTSTYASIAFNGFSPLDVYIF